MAGLRASLARLYELCAAFERKLAAAAGRGAQQTRRPQSNRLRELLGFGSNPGNLRLFTYVPAQLGSAPALVVSLHGCTQSAPIYDHGSGWSELADRHGFVVIYPEQQAANNPKNCFSWFLPADTARSSGEALSIRQMIDKAVREFGIDRGRVFVTGLSAGGAMASVMLATYPEVFAGGAIIAGLPYGSASSVQEAFEAMFNDRAPSSRALGDRVRAASHHRGRWPRVSVWHGSADTFVKPSNAEHIVRQWLNVQGLPERPSEQEQIGRHTRQVWNDAAGEAQIEAFTITGMAHGVPLAAAGRDKCGATGPFFLDAGLSSTWHIARFWGLDRDQPLQRVPVPQAATASGTASVPSLHDAATADAEEPETVHLEAETDVGAQPSLNPNDVIAAAFKAAGLPAPAPAGGRRVDPGAIIAAALKAAGISRA